MLPNGTKPLPESMLTYIIDLAQDRSNSIANALELLQFCAKPSILNSCVIHLKTIFVHAWNISPESVFEDHTI